MTAIKSNCLTLTNCILLNIPPLTLPAGVAEMWRMVEQIWSRRTAPGFQAIVEIFLVPDLATVWLRQEGGLESLLSQSRSRSERKKI